MIFEIDKYEVKQRRIDPVFREMDQVWIETPDGTRKKLEYYNYTFSRLIIQGLGKICRA